jgi:diacylglycerol kinase (ATP)
MRNILFIVNPVSEKLKKVEMRQLIMKNLDHDRFSFSLKYSEYPGHAYELAHTLQKKYQIIVAAGGDGTVSQVSRALSGTDTCLGVIPLGSGNGLARSLKIPLNPSKAIHRINSYQVIRIDTGVINGNHFINMAGIGFDAEIAHDFAASDQRGFITYCMKVLKKFRRYSPRNYTLVHNNQEKDTSAFMISFANSSQYGNNAHISPRAKLDDGLIDVCMLKKFPAWTAPILASRLFLKTIDRSDYLNILQTDRLKLKCSDSYFGHLDGEPVVLDKELDVRVIRKSLNVIV